MSLALGALTALAAARAVEIENPLSVERGASYRVTLSFENTSADDAIERVALRVRDTPYFVENLRIEGGGGRSVAPNAGLRFVVAFRVAVGVTEGASGTIVLALDVPDDTFVDEAERRIPLVVRADAPDRVVLGDCPDDDCRPEPPDVVGLRLGEAAERLADAGWEAAPTLGPPAPSPGLAGTVASASAPEGDRVPLEVYAEQVSTVAVPDLRRLGLRQAADRLGDLGLGITPELGEAAPSEELAGRVVAQEPAAGSRVGPGASVRVTVYGEPRAAAAPPPPPSPPAPSTVGVPDLSGLTLGDAESRLREAGLTMRPQLGDPAPDATRSRRIYRQSPAVGAAATPGTTVSVWVYAEARARPEPPVRPPTGSSASELLELFVPSRIGNYQPMRVQFADLSDWGRSQGLSLGRSIRASTLSRRDDITVIPRPGDRWPFVISPPPVGEKPFRHVFSGAQRLLVTYAKQGSFGSGNARRRDVGPHVHIGWSSRELLDLWGEYRSLYPYPPEMLARCFSQSVTVERPGRGWENGYVRVASTNRAAFVYFTWDDDDVEGGLTAALLEEAGREILEQVEPFALPCETGP